MFDEVYQYVDQYGLTTTKILVVAAVLLILILFATREIFAWFMKTGKIAKQFKIISRRLEQIEAKLTQVTQAIELETEGHVEPTLAKKNQFDIQH